MGVIAVGSGSVGGAAALSATAADSSYDVVVPAFTLVINTDGALITIVSNFAVNTWYRCEPQLHGNKKLTKMLQFFV